MNKATSSKQLIFPLFLSAEFTAPSIMLRTILHTGWSIVA